MSKHDRIYEVNGGRLALLLLPTRWRRPLLGSLAQAAMSAPARLISELKTYRREKQYRMNHNGQVCRLRGVLNDEFDPTERGIEIRDEWWKPEGSKIWMRETGRSMMMPVRPGMRRIECRGYEGTGNTDFVVLLPEGLWNKTDLDRLRAIVDRYRLASRRFRIEYYMKKKTKDNGKTDREFFDAAE